MDFTFKCEFVIFLISDPCSFHQSSVPSSDFAPTANLVMFCVTLFSILYLLLNVQAIKICAKCFIFSDTLSVNFYFGLDVNNAAGSVRIF